VSVVLGSGGEIKTLVHYISGILTHSLGAVNITVFRIANTAYSKREYI